jgi:phage terminase large subunit
MIPVIYTTYQDNKHLSDDFINEIEQLKATNPEKFNHIVLGGWLEKSEGVIFSNGNMETFQQMLILILVLTGMEY